MAQHDAMTREDAANQNLHKYWSGEACRKGHGAMRYTSTGACVDCVASYRKRFREPAAGSVNVIFRSVPRQLEAMFYQRGLELLQQIMAQPGQPIVSPMLTLAPDALRPWHMMSDGGGLMVRRLAVEEAAQLTEHDHDSYQLDLMELPHAEPDADAIARQLLGLY